MEFNMTEGGFTTEFEYGKLDISGNEEYGFRPYQLLVSSVAVCSGGVLRKVLEKMRYPFEDITVKAHVDRNEAEANRIERIELTFHIKTSDWNEEKIEKAMQLTRKNCSMVQSVHDSIEVVESAKWVQQ
ncbi:OsmC family protein [Pseudalkalibacillus salsuginis]|uniref:OsmC family protein n=1 Tax=Pseudalkalibacillus salsuginis TaxID=2910972 RepID=UPI001F2453C8|nr:OsmC family protein [Pseudalkalibacillus salsuginis]MCF6412089.1 OsmC family protein [Pseudalkalibacillus salsuginis]